MVQLANIFILKTTSCIRLDEELIAFMAIYGLHLSQTTFRFRHVMLGFKQIILNNSEVSEIVASSCIKGQNTGFSNLMYPYIFT